MVSRTKPEACCAPATIEPLAGDQLQRLVKLAKALADPNRIEMLRLLAAQDGPLCACDIVAHFDLSQPTVSHHLKILREAGLLRDSRHGLWVFYGVAPAGIDTLAGLTGLLDGHENAATTGSGLNGTYLRPRTR